ncbi:hypothetical protein Tco_0608635 [Tanacetum coccineum]
MLSLPVSSTSGPSLIGHSSPIMAWQKFKEVSSRYDPKFKGVEFRLGGETKTMSLLEFGWRVGLYSQEESLETRTRLRDGEFVVGGTSVKKIRDPKFESLKYVQRQLFRSLEDWEVSSLQCMQRYKALMNELVNDGVNLSKLEINTGFINGLPKKWLSFCQSLRNTNHVKDSELASLFDFQDNLDDEEDARSSHEYLKDLDKKGVSNGEWVKISVQKVHTLFEIEDNDDRKSFLDYMCIDLNYVEEQRNNLMSKHRNLVQELNTCKEQLLVLKQAKLDLLTMQHVNTEILKENQNLRNDRTSYNNKATERSSNSKHRSSICLTRTVEF